MKPKSDQEPEDDSALFRRTIGEVKPLAPTRRVTSEAPKPRARAHFTRADRVQLFKDPVHGSSEEPELAAGDPTHFSRPGIPETTLRKLRRGQYPIDAELDLHGLTAAEATAQLQEFLIAALQEHRHCLRIVHGKGLRSGTKGPVLRTLVNGTLRRMAQVVAVTSARRNDGGTGAVYVLLDPKR